LLLKAGLGDVLSRCKEDAEGPKSSDGKAKNGLDLEISENGGNLSSGEK